MEPTKPISEVLSREIWTVTPDTGVTSAARMAQSNRLRHVLVLDSGTLVGVMSARALRAARPTQMVTEVMRSPVLCVAPSTTVGEALQIMKENDVSFLPVVGNDYIIGYVSDRLLQGIPELKPDSSDQPRRQPEA